MATVDHVSHRPVGAREVTVLVPTLGTHTRASLLRRALESIVSQEHVRATAVVVFNGGGVDPDLVEEVRRLPEARISVLQNADLPGALFEGRRFVETAWLTALDDDDELLPGGLARRVTALEMRPECAAVVTNGIRRDESGDRLHLDSRARIDVDPLRAMLADNWLLPGSWLCRAEALPEAVFARMPRYLENTYLALVLASSVRVAFDVDEPTVIHNLDTPDSVSKSPEYRLGQEAALRRILELDLPLDVRREYERRLGAACASAGAALAERGELAAATRLLLRSLIHPRRRHALGSATRIALAALRR
jgi:hypothetical protein